MLITGDPAPGIPGAIFDTFQEFRGSFNDAGQVAYVGGLRLGVGGVSISSDQVIYRYSPGLGSALVARGTGPIPAIPGDSYNVNSPLFAGVGSMNALGQVAFHAGHGASKNSIFVDGTALVATTGSPAPGIPGATISVINSGTGDSMRINNASQVLYTTQLTGDSSVVTASSNTVLYRNSTVIAREGDTAPGTGSPFGQFLGVDDARMNAAGQIVFTHDLVTGAATNGVVIKHTAAGLSLVARDGDVAPGTGGLLFGSTGFKSPRINGSGQVAYLGVLVGGSNVLYIDTTLIRRDGEAAPGLAGLTLNNVGLGSIGPRVELNDAGTLMFLTNLAGPGVTGASNVAMYVGSTVLARTGSASPIAGTTFFSLNSGDFELNNLGHAIFVADVAGAGVTSSTDLVLLFWNGTSLQVLAREGDALAGSTIASLIDVDNAPKIELNNADQVLFYAKLADGRNGLFVTAAVPEPETYAMLLVGIGLVAWQLRRKSRQRSAARFIP